MSNLYHDLLVVKEKPKSYISEAYRTLRTNIEFINTESNINTIMFASAVPQEGMSICIANLAITIIENRKKVLIVDCDFRMPQIHKLFGSDNKPGLTNILIVDDILSEVLKKADEISSNLSYITSGPLPSNPSGLLGSEKMKEVIEEMKKQADIILFYSTPIIGFADSLELAKQVDGVILFLNAGIVTQDAAKQAKALLEKVKAKILGVVLNNVIIKQKDYYKYYH